MSGVKHIRMTREQEVNNVSMSQGMQWNVRAIRYPNPGHET